MTSEASASSKMPRFSLYMGHALRIRELTRSTQRNKPPERGEDAATTARGTDSRDSAQREGGRSWRSAALLQRNPFMRAWRAL